MGTSSGIPLQQVEFFYDEVLKTAGLQNPAAALSAPRKLISGAKQLLQAPSTFSPQRLLNAASPAALVPPPRLS